MFVKLITCKSEFEAEVVKGALADVGIEAILLGKHMNQIYDGAESIQFKVLVEEKDYDKAKEIIDTSNEPQETDCYEPMETPKEEESKFGCLSMFFAFALYQFVCNRIIRKYFNVDGWIEFIAEIVTACVCIGIVILCGKLIRKYEHKKKQ